MVVEEAEASPSFRNHMKTQHYRFERVLQKSDTFLSHSPKSLYIGCQLVQNGTCRSSSIDEELEVYSEDIFCKESGPRAQWLSWL
jgi:hypothetical protein